MELNQKKDCILRCIKLGMDWYESCIVAECTEPEIELLESDIAFQKLIEQKQAIQEYEWLLAHNVAMDIAKKKGNTKPIEWRLAKLNPNKYDSNNNKTIKLEAPENIVVNLVGVSVDNGEDQKN